MPLCPSQKRSDATRLDPDVPNKRTTVPFARRTDRPRQRSVKRIVCPSGAKAKSHPFSIPLMTTDRLNVGTPGAGVGVGAGVGAGVGVGVGAGVGVGVGAGLAESLPPQEARGAAMASEQVKSNATRFFTAIP